MTQNAKRKSTPAKAQRRKGRRKERLLPLRLPLRLCAFAREMLFIYLRSCLFDRTIHFRQFDEESLKRCFVIGFRHASLTRDPLFNLAFEPAAFLDESSCCSSRGRI